MKNAKKYINELLDVVLSIPKSGPLHSFYTALAQKIADMVKEDKLFLLFRRELSGFESFELTSWYGIIISV